ncbi:MAG: hypothetical protein ACLQGT_15750 [Terracidiphilus sp.]
MTLHPQFDFKSFLGYLDEAEMELLNIRVSGDTQLAAVLLLLLRASSLLRASLSLLESDQLDAYDVMRRAHWESWALAYEFRLVESLSKSNNWHQNKNKYGIPDFKMLEKYMRSYGIASLNMGRDYGGLSKLTHSTKSAASNSAIIVAARCGKNLKQQVKKIMDSKEAYEKEEVGVMYRFLWLTTEERKDLIEVRTDMAKMPSSHKFILDFVKSSPRIEGETRG